MVSHIHPSRQAFVEEGSDDDDQDMGVELTNIPLDHDYTMRSAGGETSMPSEKASAIMSQFERKRRAAAIAVPTDDTRVRARLRELKEPMTLFGEGPAERRDRLREILTSIQESADHLQDEVMRDATEQPDDEGEAQEEFYTIGTDALLNARKHLAKYSLAKAQGRVLYQKQEATIPLRSHVKHREDIKHGLATFELFGSQVAGDRPVSLARFSPNGQLVAAGHWGGGIRILDVPNLEQKHIFRGHTSQIGGLTWSPGATLPGSNVSTGSVNLASGGGEGQIHLWSLEKDVPLATLSGHLGRVCRTEFHPSGRYLASASYDTTWRMWDVETTTELLLQEGHSKEVYTVAFNPDGSLVASAGLDSIGRVWDVRSGRSVMVLDSHIKPIYALDWSIDSHRILTGSGDGFAKCWDIRKIRETTAIASHQGGVTDLHWFKGVDGPYSGKPLATDAEGMPVPKHAGTYFVSCGFDKKIKIYSSDDWEIVKVLSGHTGNVLSVDVSSDGEYIASSGHDRTVKIWKRDLPVTEARENMEE
ncbi:U4/U6 small nuclear ribonucleoprotein-like protein Prp4 [Pseudovirgaria hyperparasitica]|uniref:U4/U6 small nuclear ribonucleoprotein-like protein Prp4 n=1 Tax=Pseudovirgaria hyperparasitica TaxID=470096 RepID=A0A6A6VTW4_9PEZI|nr:U4/U6 small nuclear ribonucleoprotein-like protein Prp4 [Pseudovirgaria hyperparasitica]KAF2753236.1 U4/U6 small nuclear ribonucleoprotein-like protein Prp4 [Pseudovirgaria hyperparasitica]